VREKVYTTTLIKAAGGSGRIKELPPSPPSLSSPLSLFRVECGNKSVFT
jgi:hypothetical protein